MNDEEVLSKEDCEYSLERANAYFDSSWSPRLGGDRAFAKVDNSPPTTIVSQMATTQRKVLPRDTCIE